MSKNKKQESNIAEFTSKKMCQIIAVSRYLGSMQAEAIECMTELARRRDNGEVVDYEKIIESEFNRLPDFKVNIRKKMQIGAFDLANLKEYND